MYTTTLILLTILQMFSSIKGSDLTAEPKRVVCLYGGLKHPENKNLYPEDIDASLCTHIVYVAGGVDTEQEKVFLNPRVDTHPTGGASYSERLRTLKVANPNLKLLLFISPQNMTWVQETADRRAKIINSAVELLNETRFDGMTFFPSPMIDVTDGFYTFICEIQAEFDKHGYTLSTMTTDNFDLSSPNPAFESIYRCSSFVTMLVGNWLSTSNTTRLIAPTSLIRTTLDRYIAEGFPASKLLITIPTFGFIFTLMDQKQTGVGASIYGAGTHPLHHKEDFTITYREVTERLNDTTEEWTITRDEESNCPYAYSKTGKWMTYEDEKSIATKVNYVLEKNLGGAQIFLMDLDDFQGVSGKTFPVIRAISDNFKQAALASNVSP